MYKKMHETLSGRNQVNSTVRVERVGSTRNWKLPVREEQGMECSQCGSPSGYKTIHLFNQYMHSECPLFYFCCAGNKQVKAHMGQPSS